MTTKVRTNIVIDYELWKKARKLAIDKGVTFSKLVEEAIKEMLEGD